MKEEWKDIPEYKGKYQCSNKGNVRDINHVKIKTILKTTGYRCVYLRAHGERKSFFVHRLVAITFIKAVTGKNHVNHKDGNKLNNIVENLEWCTPGENLSHAYKNGLNSRSGEKNNMAKLNKGQVVQIYKNIEGLNRRDLAEKFNVKAIRISN